MAIHTSKTPRPPSEEHAGRLLALARDRKFQAAVSGLVDTPAEWERALGDPPEWLRSHGVDVPKDVSIRMTRELTSSTPLGTEIPAMPDPDWVPFAIREINCRTYWVPKRGRGGKLTGEYEEVRICLSLELVPTPTPGGPIG